MNSCVSRASCWIRVAAVATAAVVGGCSKPTIPAVFEGDEYAAQRKLLEARLNQRAVPRGNGARTVVDCVDQRPTERGFATEVVRITGRGRLLRTPLRPGDVIVSVEGAQESSQSRTALDHLRAEHQPGERVEIELLRAGRARRVRLRLFREDWFEPSALFRRLLRRDGDAAAAMS